MNPPGEFGSPGGRATSPSYFGGKKGHEKRHNPACGGLRGGGSSWEGPWPLCCQRSPVPAAAPRRPDGTEGLAGGVTAMHPRLRGDPAAPGQGAAPLLLSPRKYSGIKRNQGTLLKEQVKRKFKAPLLIITV